MLTCADDFSDSRCSLDRSTISNTLSRRSVSRSPLSTSAVWEQRCTSRSSCVYQLRFSHLCPSQSFPQSHSYLGSLIFGAVQVDPSIQHCFPYLISFPGRCLDRLHPCILPRRFPNSAPGRFSRTAWGKQHSSPINVKLPILNLYCSRYVDTMQCLYLDKNSK